MKKISWLLICVMIILSMASVCFASGSADEGDFVMISQETITDPDGYVIVNTLYEYIGSQTRGTKSGKAVQDVYSNTNQLLYTVTAKGKFSYGTGYCNVTFQNGSFKPATGSLWRSTPSITSGNVSSTKAYVNVSGTAKCLGFANRTYSLYLYCTSSGTLSSSFSGT